MSASPVEWLTEENGRENDMLVTEKAQKEGQEVKVMEDSTVTGV